MLRSIPLYACLIVFSSTISAEAQGLLGFPLFGGLNQSYAQPFGQPCLTGTCPPATNTIRYSPGVPVTTAPTFQPVNWTTGTGIGANSNVNCVNGICGPVNCVNGVCTPMNCANGVCSPVSTIPGSAPLTNNNSTIPQYYSGQNYSGQSTIPSTIPQNWNVRSLPEPQFHSQPWDANRSTIPHFNNNQPQWNSTIPNTMPHSTIPASYTVPQQYAPNGYGNVPGSSSPYYN